MAHSGGWDFTRAWTAAEARAFVEQARDGFCSGLWLGNGFDDALDDHCLTQRQVQHCISRRSVIVSYYDRGRPRVAFWDPDTTIVLVAGRTNEQLTFVTAFKRAGGDGYLEGRDGHWVVWDPRPQVR
ncbi:MAG: hypothetical protein HYU66_17800 [Armatimonadetes bacterium]|nr:hypothetical protein [Armatimonadota bacterium]